MDGAVAVPKSSATSLRAPPSHNASALPEFIRFPLAVILALGSSAGLYSVAAQLTGFELATVSRTLDEPWQIGALLAWRVVELYVAWSSGFDYTDAASLAVLTSAPYYSLLFTFYSISLPSALITFAIDALSYILPFALLRPVAPYNSPPANAPASTQLSSSFTVKIYITTFLSVVYAAFLYLSLQIIPRYIVTYFELRTLESAYASTLPVLLTASVPLGNAAKDLLYVPSTYLAKTEVAEKEFDPQHASLAETLAWNIGLSGWGKREDVLLSRTVLIVVLTLGTSVAKIYGTVDQAEVAGAAIWGGVFATAAAIASLGVFYVGDA